MRRNLTWKTAKEEPAIQINFSWALGAGFGTFVDEMARMGQC